MTARQPEQRISRLEFKDEGESEEGIPLGTLTDQDGAPVLSNGRWVSKQEAIRIARSLHVELLDS